MKYPVVHVLWDDSISDNMSWTTVNDAIDWEDDVRSFANTVGYKIIDTDNYVVICGTVMEKAENAGDSDTGVCGLLRIPKVSILKEVILIDANDTKDA